MRRTVLMVVALATAASVMSPVAADPPAQRDMVEIAQQAHQRLVPKAPGTKEDLNMLFGPYLVPPGQDSNRITVDLQVPNGFLLAVAPELVDATSGQIPTEQQAHIHHAHWFRVDGSPADGSAPEGWSWVFGTGEEKTQGRLDDRAIADGDGRIYGIPVGGPQVLIYMIHNKTAQALQVFVVLDVTFLHGTEAELEALGNEVHPVLGTLWGETKDATIAYPQLSKKWTARSSGTAVAMGSHIHPGGYEANVVNLGPGGRCTADADGDGYPGVTILKSRKFDRIDAAWPYSEDYQMGVTKFGWRAPIHEGDVLAQYAPYDVDDPATPGVIDTIDGLPHAWYEAMTYTGIYVDYESKPAPIDPADECNPANFQARLVNGEDTFDNQGLSVNFPEGDPRIDDLRARFRPGVTEGMLNHLWIGHADEVCFSESCDRGPSWSSDTGLSTDVVHVSAFAYVPGDLALPGSLGAPPVVKQGTVLRFINEDAAANVRHSITSCAAPCNGKYVANYPLPDGDFDSGKIGNLDPIDGGLTGDDTMPEWALDTGALSRTGLYTYFCRIHPWMRGAFELVS